MRLKAWLLFIGFLLLGGVAHAEGGCPPGMIPYRGTDLSSCGPVPPRYYNNQQQQQPLPPQWAARWGAIATNSAHGSAGAGFNQPNREAAEQAALAECQSNGGSACKVEISYGNACVAMAAGDTGHNAKAGPTIENASQAAMKVCSDADTNCRVAYTSCSLPVRIQ
jgi:hypothetical protein